MAAERGQSSADLIIVTRDRPESLERALESCLESATEGAAEFLVVDQSIGNETHALVSGWPGVRCMRSDPGLALGRNEGLAATGAPIVVFTDDDVIVPRCWVESIVASFRTAPEVGAVCGRAVTFDGTLLAGRAAGFYKRPASPFRLGSGFNMAFRREALDDARAFDEALGAGARFRSGEDTDMLWRVMQAGWTVLCSDDIQVVHDDRRSRADQLRVHHGYGIGGGAFTIKHVRSGDRLAARVGVGELLHHCWIFVKSILLLRGLMAILQVVFVAGFVRGLTAGWGAFRREGALPSVRTDRPTEL
jgi:GT2 family glycosyltransferase